MQVGSNGHSQNNAENMEIEISYDVLTDYT